MREPVAILTGLLIVAAAVWLGGLVVIFVVARVAKRTLAPADRIAFFRLLGRRYGVVGTAALAIALGTGAALLRSRPWDGPLIATAATSAVLVLATALGMAQAHRMTAHRRAVLQRPADSGLQARVRRASRTATALRVAIGLCSIALVAFGAMLST